MLVLLQSFGGERIAPEGPVQHACVSFPQGLQVPDWQEYHGLLHVEPQQSWFGPPHAAHVAGTVPKSQAEFAALHAGLAGQQREPIDAPHASQVPDAPLEVLHARRGVTVVLQMLPVQQGRPIVPQPWQIVLLSQMRPVLQVGVSQQCAPCVPQALLQLAPAQ